MSKKLDTYKEFTFGVGTGESDLKVVALSQREEYEGIDIEGLLGSGEVIDDLVDQGSFDQNFNFMILPGYFYVGDRECYAFGKKMTQISKPIYSSGGVDNPYPSGTLYIPLEEIPDGQYNYALPTTGEPYGMEMPHTSAAPINVSRYEPGSLTDLSAVLDTVIEHNTGYGGSNAYRTNPDDNLPLPGEDPNWPACFSPLSRYSVLSSYWRSEEPALLPDEIYYDIEYNSIVLYDDGTEDHEYIIEFEGLNEPFKVSDVDLSPVETMPGNHIFCLSPDPENEAFKEEPYEVVVHTPKTTVNSELISVVAEVRSIKGNRLKGEDIRFRLLRKDVQLLKDTTLENYDEFINGGPFCVCQKDSISGVIIDKVAFPSGMIYEGEVLISDNYRIEGYSYTRSAGYLTMPGKAPLYESGGIPDTASYEQVVTTDKYGLAMVDYLAPHVNSSSFDIEIEADVITGSGVIARSVITLLSDQENTRYSIPFNDLWYDRVASGEVNVSGEYEVKLPIECISPSSAKVIKMSDYLESLYNGSTPEYIHPTRIGSGVIETCMVPLQSGIVSGEICYEEKFSIAFYHGFNPGTDVVLMSYLDKDKITRGDTRDRYES